MKLLDGLRGIDFAGIGDDSGIPSWAEFNPAYITNVMQTQVPAASSGQAYFNDQPQASYVVPPFVPTKASNYSTSRMVDPANDPPFSMSKTMSKFQDAFSNPDLWMIVDRSVTPEKVDSESLDNRYRALNLNYNRGSAGPGKTTPFTSVLKSVAEILDAGPTKSSTASKSGGSILDSIANAASSAAGDVKKAINDALPSFSDSSPTNMLKSAPKRQATVPVIKKDEPNVFKLALNSFLKDWTGTPDSGSPAAPNARPSQTTPKGTPGNVVQPDGQIRKVNPGQPGTQRANQPSSFSSDFNAVINGILSVVTPIAAAKQAKQQQRDAQGPSGGAGARGSVGQAANPMNTYLMIGGGVLVVGALVYMVAKR